MDKYKANAWSTTNEVATIVDWKVYFHQGKAHYKTKGIVPHNHCSAQPLEQLQLLQYSKLQMAKTAVKASFVQVYNTYIPHDSQLWMGKYKAHT